MIQNYYSNISRSFSSKAMLEVTLYSELEAEHPQERQLITQAAQAAFALFDFP